MFSCGSSSNLEDYNLEIYAPKYATGFCIVGAEGKQSTIIRVTNPWQSADQVEAMLFIARDGEKAPADFRGQVLKGDAERVVCMSSSYIAMLDAIGAVERVVGVSGKNFITNPYIVTNQSTIADVGYDGNINFELLVAQQPDIVLLYGITGACTIESKLNELGIPYIYIGEYVEEEPLGKTEWLVALAEIAGRREQGEAYFSEVPKRYENLKSLATAATSPMPKVMINTPYADSWFMASTTSYVARLIADAGGDYIYKRNTSNHSLPIDIEEAALLTTEADIWLNVESVNSLQDLKNQHPKFANMPCVLRGEVYSCNKRRVPGGGNDYWESGVVQPDVVLRDLIKIFHPELESDKEFVYYRRLE
jgi:iron complex transport system substrate-binding protein